MNYNLWVGMSITCIATGVAAICALALWVSRWKGGLVKPTVRALYVGMFLTMAAFFGQPETMAHLQTEHLLLVVLVGVLVALATVHIAFMKAFEGKLDPEPSHVKRPFQLLLAATIGVLLTVVFFQPTI